MCPPWLGCCVRLAGLVSQFVSHLAFFHLGWGAVSASLGLPICLPICLPSGFVFHLGWGAVSASLGLPISLPSGFVFHLGWGAVSASLGLSPNLSPTWLCLLRWLGCCVRLAGLVSQFVSHLALSFTLAGVCPPRWACLLIPQTVYAVSASLGLSPVLSPSLSPIWSGMLCPPRWSCLSLVCGLVCHLGWEQFTLCPPRSGLVSGLVSQLVSHLVWDAVSASLVLSFSCLRSCLPSWLGCCVRLAGLSPVLSPSLSPIWSGMLCPPPWSCLSLFSGLVSQLLSLFCLVACLSSPGLVFFLSLVLSPSLSPIWSGMLCPPRWSCLSLLCGLVSGLVCHLGRDAMLCPPCWAVSGLVSQLVSHLVWDALSASLVLSFSCLWSCLPAFVFVLSRSLSFIWDAASAPAGLVFFLSPSLSGMLCSPSWLVSQPSLSPVFCPILFSSWSGVSVLWACLQNFMCDLCNCVGSTVV